MTYYECIFNIVHPSLNFWLRHYIPGDLAGLVAAHLILRVVEELLLKENDLLLPVEAKLHVTDANSMGVE